MPIGTPSVSWSTPGRVLACRVLCAVGCGDRRCGGAVSLALAPRQLRQGCVVGAALLAVGRCRGVASSSRGPWAVALSRGWYVIGRGVAGGGPWCRRGAERRRGSVRISRDKGGGWAQALLPLRTFLPAHAPSGSERSCRTRAGAASAAGTVIGCCVRA